MKVFKRFDMKMLTKKSFAQLKTPKLSNVENSFPLLDSSSTSMPGVSILFASLSSILKRPPLSKHKLKPEKLASPQAYPQDLLESTHFNNQLNNNRSLFFIFYSKIPTTFAQLGKTIFLYFAKKS